MPRPPVKAQAVAADLAPKIFDGTYPAESWLPSERELAEEYEADRSTIRRALRMLEAQGLITVHKNTGAQVRSKSSPVVRRHAGDVTRQVGSWRGFHLSAMETGRQQDTGPGGMYSRLEDAGLSITFEDMVACRLPDKREQEVLEIGLNQPVLVVWRRCYDQAGQILEVNHRVIAADRQQLIYRYN